MAIHKPALSVKEARRLAVVRSAASELMANVPTAGESPVATDPVDPATPTVPSVRPAPRKAAVVRPSAAPTAYTAPAAWPAANRPKKVQVFVSAFVPAPDVSAIYDILSRQYPPQKSLQMILRRALADYDAMLADGSFSQAPITYPEGILAVPGPVQTSHMMAKTSLSLARAHFDPLGLESSRAFGLKLATAALAAFFAREVKRHS